jgi:putative transposase
LRCTSKEAYAPGIADLVVGLHNWSDAEAGRRKGARVGFPRYKARHRDPGRVRFTTGAMRLEPDRHHLTLSVIGKLRSKENTRRLERLIVNGRGHILSMTLSQRGDRLVVAVQAIVAQQPHRPAEPYGRCGVDLGIGPEWAIIAHHDGTIERVAHPAPWKEVRQQQRRLARQSPVAPSGPEPTVTRNQAGGAGPAGGEPPQPGHPRLDNPTGARRYATVVVEDLDVAAGVSPHRQPGRHRPGPPDARAQVPGNGRRWIAMPTRR